MAASLSDRSRLVLAALVREYIETGEPVASLTLARQGHFGVSSATMRNILARLEADGYVRQPHTSAGRVPTDLGYRCYVDMLLDRRRPARPAPGLERALRERARMTPLVDSVIEGVPPLLSSASRQVGFAVAPAGHEGAFHQIEFVPLTGTKILVVVVARGGQITQKVVDPGESIEPIDLQQAANYLNREYSGLPLVVVRQRVLQALEQDRMLYDALLARALLLARSTFEDLEPQTSVFIEGASSLVAKSAEATSVATLKALVKMVENRHRLLRILDEYIDQPGLTVVIGHEHRTSDLQEFSLVASTYSDGTRTGTVGIIGPTRMRYARAIAIVDSVAQAVSHVLTEGGWQPSVASHGAGGKNR